MGFYARHIGPRLVGCLCSSKDIAAERLKVVPQASGVVLEIGIGPGLNLAFYDPARVTRVIGVDPIDAFLDLGSDRHAQSPVALQILRAGAEELPLDDASVDTAVVTFTLCSVADPAAALREIRRVLRPSGRVLFLEHGRSHDLGVARWQDRVNPVWKRLAVGCNLNRPVKTLLTDSGFAICSIEHHYLPHAPRFAGFLSHGSAVPA